MKKEDIWFLAALAGIFSISFVSAAMSIRDYVYFIDPDNVSFVIIFIISFILIFLPVNKVFRNNPASAATIALAMAFGITYAFFRSGLDITDWFSFVGISEVAMYNIAMGLAIIILIFFIIKFGIARGIGFILLLIAGLLVIGAWTDLVYEKGVALVTAVIMAVIAFFLLGKKKDSLSNYGYSGYRPMYGQPKGLFRRALGGTGKVIAGTAKVGWRGVQLTGKGIELAGRGLKRAVTAAANARRSSNAARQAQKNAENARTSEESRAAAEESARQAAQAAQAARESADAARQAAQAAQQNPSPEANQEAQRANQAAREAIQDAQTAKNAAEQAQQQVGAQVQRKQRTQKELQQKYYYYAQENFKITQPFNGRIPPKGTPEYHKYSRNVDALKAIENLARKNGYELYNTKGQRII